MGIIEQKWKARLTFSLFVITSMESTLSIEARRQADA